jgi:hypothetical protein
MFKIYDEENMINCYHNNICIVSPCLFHKWFQDKLEILFIKIYDEEFMRLFMLRSTPKMFDLICFHWIGWLIDWLIGVKCQFSSLDPIEYTSICKNEYTYNYLEH